MGKRLIVPNANFSENALAIPMRVTVAANQTITVDGVSYTAGEEDTVFELNSFSWLRNQFNKIKNLKIEVDQIGNPTDYIHNGDFGMFPSGEGITDTIDISKCGRVYLGQYICYHNPVKTFIGFEKIVLGRTIANNYTVMPCLSSVENKLTTGNFIEGSNFKNLFFSTGCTEVDCSSLTIITNCNNMFGYDSTYVVKMIKKINLANADFSLIDESDTDLYANMFKNDNQLTEIIVTNCNAASKTFLINRLADAGFTFTESTPGVLTKSV